MNLDDIEAQLIVAALTLSEIHIVQQSGLTADDFVDNRAKISLKLITEYQDLHHGEVPSLPYLYERGVMPLPVYNPQYGSTFAILQAVKQALLRRRMGGVIQELSTAAALNPEEAMARLHALSGHPTLWTPFVGSKAAKAMLADEVTGVIHDYFNPDATGLQTPFPTINSNIGGLLPGRLYVIYADPKVGKTWTALQIIKHLYLQGKRTLIVTSEMPIAEVTERLFCLVQEVSYDDLIARTIPTMAHADVFGDPDFFEAHRPNDIHFFVPSETGAMAIAEVRQREIELNADGKLALVLWDGYYRSSPSDEWTDIYAMTRGVKRLCVDPKVGTIPHLITAQEGSNKNKPTHKVLEQEGDVVWQLKFSHGSSTSDMTEAQDELLTDSVYRKLITRWCRRGRKMPARLHFDLDHGRIVEAPL